MRMDKSKRYFFSGIIISALIAILIFFQLIRTNNKNIEHIRDTYAVRMEQFINTSFHQTDILRTVIQTTKGEISRERFDEFATTIYDNTKGIIAVQLLPDGVVEYCYPIEGNEDAIGGESIFEDPDRKEDAYLSLKTGSIVLSGPYQLYQGGIGCVVRNPIFLENNRGEKHFWGFSVIVYNLEKMIKDVGLSDISGDFCDFQLFNDNELGEHTIIAGNSDFDMKHAAIIPINVPHHQWMLAVKNKMSYLNVIVPLLIFLIGAVFSFLISRNIKMLCTMQDAIQSKDRFLATMSHDMRTPMNAILGFAKIGIEEKNKKEIEKCFHFIIESGQYLLGLINDALDVAKVTENKLQFIYEKVSFLEFERNIKTILLPKANEKNIELIIRRNFTHDILIEADRLRLQQVFINLISNAIKFTAEGGKVEFNIDAGILQSDKTRLFSMTVKDNGIGISQEFIENRLFKAFEQENRNDSDEERGTGLGLSITKYIVEIMGGSIFVESDLGIGTIFTVKLPFKIYDKDENITKNDTSPLYTILNHKRVLLCEDHPLNLRIAKKLLEKAGIEIVHAENGKIGLELFAESEEGFFDCVLMDIRMPIMDGLTASKKIRELSREDAKKVPIIAMTANAFEEDRNASLEAGMNEHIAKPFDAEQLYNILAYEIKIYTTVKNKYKEGLEVK